MPRQDLTTVRMPRDLVQKVKAQRKSRQPFAGVIEDLLNNTGCITDPETLKRLERYRTHARETIGDLITNALDQLDELEKTLTKR